MKEISTGARGFKNLPVFVSSAIITIICIFFSVCGASAQGRAAISGSSHESERAAQVRALNNSILQLHGQMQENVLSAAGIHSQAAIVLGQRAAALQTLIQEDPHAALAFAFSPELLADLAAKFPDSATQLESHVTLSGTAERWVGDDLKNPSASTESWFLKVNETRLALHFATPRRPTAATVTITGVKVAASVAVSDIANGSQATLFPTTAGFQGEACMLLLATMLFLLARRYMQFRVLLLRRLLVCTASIAMLLATPLVGLAQTCSTIGTQKTAVLLISFQDLAVAMTPSDANDVVFDTSAGHSVNGFWQDASRGQISASGSVFGPVTVGLSTSYSCSNITQVFYDAVSASGLNLTSFNRIFIFMPGINCAWGGFTINAAGNAGCTQWSTTSGTVTASLSFVIDSLLSSYGRDSAVQTSSHEGGHQLMLGHAGTQTDEPTSVLGPASSPGGRTEFNDFFSVMGEGLGYTVLSGYGAQHQAEELGWLTPNTNWQAVTSGGSYTLSPLEVNSGGLQALKVARGTGNTSEYLWVEYRQPVGYDSTNFFMNFNGALIHYAPALPNYASKYTSVMDFTPSDVGRWFNTVLAPGQTWTDSYSNVSIKVLSATSSGLTINVSYGAVPCNSSAPTVSASPLNPSVYPGQTASYSVSVTNNDSSGCSSSTIYLGSTEPSGWSTSLSASAATLSPGQSASLTMVKGAPSGIPAGTYAVNLTASNTVASTTDMANATVVMPPSLNVSLSVAAASYTRPGSASITAAVSSGGSPASGASVTFTLTMPNGGTTTQTTTTGSNGSVAWNYKLNQRSQAGTYSVTAQVSLSSGSKKSASTQSTTSNTVSFAVQ